MAQQGSRNALNTLITRYWQPVYRLAWRKIGNADDAQEITQEVFLRVFKSLPHYKITGASFNNYLARITINLANDFWRKKGRTPPVIDITEYQNPLVDKVAGPDEHAISSEAQATLAAFIKQLPADQRQTVELRIIAGLSIRQAAEIMGKSDGSVKMLQQRALKNLRKLCIEHGIAP